MERSLKRIGVDVRRARNVPGKLMPSLSRNALLAGLQTVFSACAMFLVYRRISSNLGISAIGAWSVLFSTGSLASIFDVGVSDAMVRQIARARSSQGADRLKALFVTGLATAAATVFAGTFVVAPLLTRLAGSVLQLPPGTLSMLLLGSLVSAWFNVISASCFGAIEGLERYDVRCMGSVLAGCVVIACSVGLVPRYGYAGVALTFVLQSATLAAVSLIAAWRLFALVAEDRGRYSVEALGELVRCGLPLKMFGLTTLALDPLARIFAAHFGGAGFAGVYELAARVVMQIRGLAVAMTQVILPRLSAAFVVEAQETVRVERAASRANVFGTLLGFGGLFAGLPVFSMFILGRVDPLLVNCSLALAGGWFLNAVSAPAYFANIAAQRMRWNWMSHSTMGAANILLGLVLGVSLGGFGVALATGIAVALGSLVTILGRYRDVGKRVIIIRAPEGVLGATVIAVAIAVATRALKSDQSYLFWAAVLLLGAVICAAGVSLTLMRREAEV